ncbi:MAG: hemolysin family protein [Oscillospiraceae bacterium]|nr:hemolysin family protein [Oscillospiraceae bacterium]
MVQAIILQILLIAFNSVFSCAEIAVISMSDAKLKQMAQDGDKRAKKLLALTEEPSKFLATIQVAITLASLLGGAFAADNFADPLTELLITAGLPVTRAIVYPVILVIITLLLTYFSIVFGELVPKRLAMKKTEQIALGLSGVMYVMSKICAPLVWLLTKSTNGVLRLLGIDPDSDDDVVTEEEIKLMLAEGNEQGTIMEEESELINNVFDFTDMSVEQVSTRRRDVIFLYIEDGDEAWAKTIMESRHTYYPVCQDSPDNVVGILDTKDYFRSDDRSIGYMMEHAVNKPYFVPEEMRANSLFAEMKKSRNYFAVVLDEYGGMSGIVTLHDLIEELVGELEEEEAPPKPDDIAQIDEETWCIQGCAELEEVEEALGVSLPTDTFDTFSGFICEIICRVPEEGESFECESNGLEIQVKNVQDHLIDYAIVKKLPPEAEEDEDEEKE